MAGNIKINGAQFGDNATAANNLVLTTPAAPDGSLTLSRGNLGATTANLLTIGSAGNITFQPAGANLYNVNGINSGPIAGLRNRIINGDARVAQRQYWLTNGSVSIPTTGTYVFGGADRIRASINLSSGSLTSAILYKQTAGPSTVGGVGTSHAVQVTATGPGEVRFSQCIETANTWDLNFKLITISAKVYQDTGATQGMYIAIAKPPTTANAFTNSPTAINSSASIPVPSGVLTTVSATFQLSGNDASLGLAPVYVMQFATAVSSKYFTITDMQLEVGPVASPFEYRPFGLELLMCQRYFEAVNHGFAGVNSSTTSGYLSGRIGAKMAAPTVTTTGTMVIYTNGTNMNATVAGALTSSDGSIMITLTGYSGTAINQGAVTTSSNSTSWLAFNAEMQ